MISLQFLGLSSVSSDDVPDGSSTERTFPSRGPLLDGTLEAHAHVATGVEDTVHVTLIADDALSLDHGGVRRTGLGSGLEAGVGPT